MVGGRDGDGDGTGVGRPDGAGEGTCVETRSSVTVTVSMALPSEATLAIDEVRLPVLAAMLRSVAKSPPDSTPACISVLGIDISNEIDTEFDSCR